MKLSENDIEILENFIIDKRLPFYSDKFVITSFVLVPFLIIIFPLFAAKPIIPLLYFLIGIYAIYFLYSLLIYINLKSNQYNLMALDKSSNNLVIQYHISLLFFSLSFLLVSIFGLLNLSPIRQSIASQIIPFLMICYFSGGYLSFLFAPMIIKRQIIKLNNQSENNNPELDRKTVYIIIISVCVSGFLILNTLSVIFPLLILFSLFLVSIFILIICITGLLAANLVIKKNAKTS